MDHDIVDYKDQSAVLLRLGAALPAALAVRDYWNGNQPLLGSERQAEWTADPVMPHETHWRSYTAPGSLFLKVGPHAAKIRTGGRWRGFLSIPPLYQVHLQAFCAIAQALGASQAVYFADCDDVYDVFYEDGDVEAGIGILKGYMGLPQPSINEITAEIAAKAECIVPSGIMRNWRSQSMTDNFQKLHDKATRGELMTAEEENELAVWYARLDQEEATLLTSPSRSSLTAEALQVEIENALTHLQATAQQVREQINENEALRRDIITLTQQLAQTKTLQTA